MANFGVEELTVVTDEHFDREAARPVAAGADWLLESTRVVPTLEEAITGSTLVVGTTRRLGEKRKPTWVNPWELSAQVQAHPGARLTVVFGNERAGLSDAELVLCHLALAIPSSPACPSLNLSHAVGIIAWELYRASLERPGPIPAAGVETERKDYADVATLEESITGVVGALERLGYRWHAGPRGIRTFLRDLLARALPSREEAERFRALFEKLAGMHGAPNSRSNRGG
jgi:TrmH family RNA methyltransferase